MGVRENALVRTRAKTIDTAAKLFAQHGYEAVTMRGLATAMGMSTGAVFSVFPDKPAIYAAVYDHIPVSPELGRKMLLGLRAYFTADDDPKEALQALADLSVAAELEVKCPE
jgi:AcrR family transcriptional regulator